MSQAYDASAIEVLTGLEPVRKRPGMYTDTQRPNHLAQEVIDNSVDEAISGHAKRIDVVLHSDGSLAVTDDDLAIGAMPASFRADRAVNWNKPLRTRRSRRARPVAKPTSTAAAKTTVKRPAATAPKTTAKSSAARKTTVKAKPAATKTKASAKKPVVKSSVAKKPTGKQPVAKKPTAKKVVAKPAASAKH